MRILIFGDSISQGYFDLEMGGWVNLLAIDVLKRKVRRNDNPTEVFNVSVSGDTTRRVITRLKAEIKPRLWKAEPVLLIFAIGINDTHLENDRPVSTLEQFATELEELYGLASSSSNHIIFIGLQPVDEAESSPWKFNIGPDKLSWKNSRIRLFDTQLKNFAESRGAGYIPIFDAFIKQQQKGVKLHADGLHPNSDGHKLMYQLIQPTINEVYQRLKSS